jgi:hypothetical protein
VSNASLYFRGRHYNDAFEQVYGLKIKDNDQLLYDKIMTVLYVNKQLNSYNNYTNAGLHPQAIDSLIKGLKTYWNNYQSAETVQVVPDYDYLQQIIKDKLFEVYHIDDEAAWDLMDLSDQDMVAYSERVTSIAKEIFPDDSEDSTDSVASE